MLERAVPHGHLVYRAGFDRNTLEFLEQDNKWEFECSRFLYKDMIRLLVVKKIG